MIGVDTNVLVRYVVEDDPIQTSQAVSTIEGAIARNEVLFITHVVLCELVWVLSYAYRFNREEIVGVLQQLRRGAQVMVEGPDEVRHAIESFASQRGDLADYLIAERAMANGCTSIVTFDRALYPDPRFIPPDRVR